MGGSPSSGTVRSPSFDSSWITRGLSKHRANYSSAVCFDTIDPRRLHQLKEFFCSAKANDLGYGDHTVYLYDPWNGLAQLDKATRRVTIETSGEGRHYQGEVGSQIRDLAGCLNIMESRLKAGNTVLVLYWLQAAMEHENLRNLLSALKAWATSEALIRGKSLVLVLASDSSALLDDSTRRLMASIQVDSSSDAERKELTLYLSRVFGISLTDEQMATVESAVRGLDLHQAEAVLRESYYLTSRFDLGHIKKSKGELVKQTGVLEIEEPTGGFEAIGGYAAVKDMVHQKIVKIIRNSGQAREWALSAPRGILLFGPPGTGKTLFARSLAKEIEYPFINLRTENIYSRWLGESGSKMRSAIRTAEEMSPAIVFVDEIDRMGRRTATSDSAGEETRRVFSQMLEWLGDQNRKAIIVGTTNRPQDLDEAFIRPGRFDYKVPLLYPDDEARLDVLRIHLGLAAPDGTLSPKRKPPLLISDEAFLSFLRQKIVPRTENYTGAELEELVTRSKRCAFEGGPEPVGPEHFCRGLRSFRIDLDSRCNQQREFEDLARKFTDDETFLERIGIASGQAGQEHSAV